MLSDASLVYIEIGEKKLEGMARQVLLIVLLR